MQPVFLHYYLFHSRLQKNISLYHKQQINTAMSNKMMQQLIADYFKTQPIQKAWLFGSFARGEETPLSDVDLLVQYDDEGISLLKHAAMICELEEILDRPVDIVPEGTLYPKIAESINQDKILIYAKNTYLTHKQISHDHTNKKTNEQVIYESAVHKNLIQTTARMKSLGYETNEICKITGLSRDEIEGLS